MAGPDSVREPPAAWAGLLTRVVPTVRVKVVAARAVMMLRTCMDSCSP